MHDESNMKSSDWLIRGISPKKLAKEKEKTLKKATKELERIEKRKKKNQMPFSEKLSWISLIAANAVISIIFAILAYIAPTISQTIFDVALSLCWGAVTGLNIAGYIHRKKQHNNSETENEK